MLSSSTLIRSTTKILALSLAGISCSYAASFPDYPNDIPNQYAGVPMWTIKGAVPAQIAIERKTEYVPMLWRYLPVVRGNATYKTTRPAGTRIQWLSFRFKSTGYSQHNDHLTIVLLANNDALNHWSPSKLNLVGKGFANAPSLIGAGIIIDPTHYKDSCPTTAYATAIEGFWGTNPIVPGSQPPATTFPNNAVYGFTCSKTSLADGTWYSITVHANVDGWVAIWGPGGEQYANTFNSEADQLIPAPRNPALATVGLGTGIYIGTTFPIVDPAQYVPSSNSTYYNAYNYTFKLELADVKTGWF